MTEEQKRAAAEIGNIATGLIEEYKYTCWEDGHDAWEAGQTINTLLDKMEADGKCVHCSEPEETNASGRKFFKTFPNEGRPVGVLGLVQDADGLYKLHYEYYDQDENVDIVEDFEVSCCPGCGRQIEKEKHQTDHE